MKGAGIVALLIVAGIALSVLGMSIGDFAIKVGIFFAIVFALLGVFGILKRYI